MQTTRLAMFIRQNHFKVLAKPLVLQTNQVTFVAARMIRAVFGK
jgi:hypothetical protein